MQPLIKPIDLTQPDTEIHDIASWIPAIKYDYIDLADLRYNFAIQINGQWYESDGIERVYDTFSNIQPIDKNVLIREGQGPLYRKYVLASPVKLAQSIQDNMEFYKIATDDYARFDKEFELDYFKQRASIYIQNHHQLVTNEPPLVFDDLAIVTYP